MVPNEILAQESIVQLIAVAHSDSPRDNLQGSLSCSHNITVQLQNGLELV